MASGRLKVQVNCWLALVLGLELLARTAMAAGSEVEQIAEALSLGPGKTVADVGAGDGEWSERLSKVVGEGGRVLATEIAADQVQRLAARFAERDLRNAEAVLGQRSSTGLEGDCCDAILLRLVYHHLTDPDAIAADLYRAVRSTGRVAVIDFLPQRQLRALPGVPERGGHGIRPETLIAEMERVGFRVVTRRDTWDGDPQRFCVAFERSH
jgi:ubiquinone/menaquinone biosynthesis C-methylase UbiE